MIMIIFSTIVIIVGTVIICAMPTFCLIIALYTRREAKKERERRVENAKRNSEPHSFVG